MVELIAAPAIDCAILHAAGVPAACRHVVDEAGQVGGYLVGDAPALQFEVGSDCACLVTSRTYEVGVGLEYLGHGCLPMVVTAEA